MKMRAFLLSVMRGENPLMFWLFLIHGFVSGFFTFRGLSLDAEGFMETAAFAVFAIGIGSLIFAFWHFAFLVLPTLKSPKQRVMGWTGILFGLGFIIWASCMPNLTAGAGRLAKEHHAKQSIVNYEEMRDLQFDNAMSVSGLAVILDGHHMRFDGYQNEEFAKGTFSGSRGGSGAVHLSLKSVRDRMESMRDLASDHVRLASDEYDKASDSIAEMRRMMNLDKPLSERSRLIAIESDRAFKAITAMNPKTLAVSFERMAKSLPDELVVPRTLSRNSGVAKAQTEAIGRLKEDIKRTARAIGDPSAEIIKASAIAVTRFEPMSGSKAARTYWQQFTPHLIAAFALDMFPLCILLFLTASLGFKSEKEIATIELKNMTVQELYRAIAMRDILQAPHLDPRGIEHLKSSMIGHHKDGDES